MLPGIGVLCSGRGTNLQAILDATRRGRIKGRVALVLCDNPDAMALQRAKRAKVPAQAILRKDYPSREAFEQAYIDALDAAGVSLVCLAGFMRILSPLFVGHFAGRIMNIHPSLLPSFPGASGVRDAMEWGVKVTGVTVHLVDEKVDHGPIVLQEAVTVEDRDSENRLLAKVHAVEHKLYPRAIQMMLEGKVKFEERKTKIRGL
jgi:phosphoribosylglycinamide formyltransferase 1